MLNVANKNIVLFVKTTEHNVMAKHLVAVYVFIVSVAKKHLYGRDHIIKNIKNSTGSSYGSLKVIPSDSWLDFQVTVNLSLNELKITG